MRTNWARLVSQRAAVSVTILALAATAAAAGTAVGQQTLGAPGGAGQNPAAGPPPQRQDPFAGADLSAKAPVLPRTPAQEQALFQLKPGYHLTPVLTDPLIEQPAQIAFDGNGRMFVLELRTYMLDASAKDELLPVSRISRWEDKNNDGVYESGVIFVDSLVFPRFVTPYGANSVLTMESNGDEVWKYTDTDGDGKADKKELFTTGFGRSGNVEHQQASLFWAMDNWLYSTVNAFRVRETPSGVVRENTGSNGAQWGITQDNYGKVWFQNGAEGIPSYFQFPIEYGTFNVPDQLGGNFRTPYGAPIGIADMQGGMSVIRMPDGSLSSVTAGAGNDIFRGDRLPAELKGDYFYGETVARIVRRIHPTVTAGITQLNNVYEAQQSEFIRSTDPLFRPLDMTTAPDGTMYITDMYHGIIQEAAWTGPGSYLRAKIDQYQLDKNIRMGRIWRLTYDGIPRRATQPHMLTETPAQLVAHFTDPNGWWRDMAQQLLVAKKDKSVVPALKSMARGKDQLARIHAIWTLEGLNSLDAALARELMKDADPQIRMAAIRASESLYKAGDRTLAADYRTLAKDRDVNVVLQAMMTLNTLKVPGAAETVRTVKLANNARGIQDVGNMILNPRPPTGFGAPPVATLTAEQTAMLTRGAQVFSELCSQCHGETGLGKPTATGGLIAPALSGDLRVQGHPEYVISVLLHGLTGPIEGMNYEGATMIPQNTQSDDWIAAVASYVRNTMGNSAGFVTADQVTKVRAATASRSTPYTYPEITAAVPQALPYAAGWKVSASQNSAAASGAFNYQGWNSGAPQSPLWFQIELPQAVNLTEVRFSSAGGGLGGGGGGPRPAGAPGAPAGAGGAPAGAAPGAAPTASPPAGGAPGGPGAAAGTPRPAAAAPAPRTYRVEVSNDGTSWTRAAETETTGNSTVIPFNPVSTRFVRISQIAPTENAPAWSIQQMRLFTRGSVR